MAVDEDHTTIQEQQEQDGTLKDQQQQKEAEEENAAEASNDAAMVEVNGSGEANNYEEGEEEEEEEEEDDEEEEEEGGGGGGGGEDEEEDEEEEDSEDLYMLLHPFTKEQMHALAKQAIEKHPDLAEYGRRVALYGAIPVDPEIFQKEIEYYEDNPVDSEEEEDLDLENAPVEKLLEIFNARELEAIIKKGVKKYPDIAEIVRQQADVNPAHRKVLVHTHGLGWDATAESLTSVFGKHGEIEDCEYVTDKHSGKFKCCAFILFKHGSGARKALKQPLKKIGNRTTVCKFASSGGHVCWYLYDDVESAKNALEELHKVVDGYHQQQQHHHQPTGPAVGGYNPGLPQQGVQALYASLISRSGQKDALELENFLGWLGGAPANQAEPVPVAYCNEAAMNLGNQLGMQQ